ncbi:MAG: RNA polymerase sigma factor [Oscillospiraceae bacterium]
MTDSRFEICIQLIRNGERDGLREIYEEYFKLIFSVMQSVVKNREDAEDLTSDFFVKLWDRLADAYKGGNGHKSWLVAAARNMAIDRLRRNSRTETTLNAQEETGGIPEPKSGENLEEAVIGSITVSEALAVLSETECMVVSLKLFSDFTFKEIAKALKMPQGTVAWRYQSAVKKLQNYFKGVCGT